MSRHNKTIGNIGEELAATRYTQAGFQITGKNQRTKSGEIDIVASKNGYTHFIEVKTRTSDKMGNPEEAITPRRHTRLINCAAEYANEHSINAYQIDVVSIKIRSNHTPEIIVFENI